MTRALHSSLLMGSVLSIMGSASFAQLAAEDCAEATSFAAPDVSISQAELVEARDGMPEYCDVRGNIRKNIGFALHLPSEWNGRFNMVGNGGKAGSINLDDMKHALPKGLATASTDTGHDNNIPEQSGARFGTDMDMEIDFGWRAVHETAATAKAVISDFYGSEPAYSYWTGCSTGGRQGLMEAQRFPGTSTRRTRLRQQSWGCGEAMEAAGHTARIRNRQFTTEAAT